MRQELANPRLFVRLWFHKKGYKMRPDGTYAGNGPNDFAHLWLDYKDILKAENSIKKFDPETGKRITEKVPHILEKDMEKAWLLMLDDERIAAIQDVRTKLQFTSSEEFNGEIEKWLSAVVGSPSDLEVAVIKHVLWLVKRKLASQKVVWHLMPVFWAEQGGGKSEAIKKLVEPVEGLALSWDVSQSIDSRNLQTLAENYLCVFDEMAKMQRVDIETMKRIISLEYANYRPLFSHRNVRVKQNCTFLGISNKSMSETINDETGLRRFVQLTCLKKLDWDVINSIDSLKMWQSINEQLERGYIEPYLTELQMHQESLVVPDELPHFIDELEIRPIDGGPVEEVTSLDLYTAFNQWRVNAGYGTRPGLDHVWFGRKLPTYRLSRKYKKIAGAKKAVYTINANSSVFRLFGEGRKQEAKADNVVVAEFAK